MNYDFITIGGATEDIMFYTNEGVLIEDYPDILKQKLLAFEFGAKIQIDKTEYTFGGGAANAAATLSSLGFKTASLTCLGSDDRGKRIKKNFQKHGISLKLIQRDDKKESTFSVLVIGPSKEHVIFSNKAASSRLEITDQDLKQLEKSSWLYLTSMTGNWEANFKKLFSAKQPKISWNPGLKQLKAGYSKLKPFLNRTNILCVNQDEAIELVTSKKDFVDKPREFLNKTKNLLPLLADMGPEMVVITKGEKGAEAYDALKNKYYTQPAKEVKTIKDTTGMGDSFNSAFTAYFHKYQNIQKALEFGALNAASVIKKSGSQNGILKKKI